MNRLLVRLPLLVTLLIVGLLVAHGPVAQLPHYHEFADRSVFLGIPHAADVLSNGGFALVAVWGMLKLWPVRQDPALASAWHGYRLFLIALLLTAAGSAYYHLQPDNGSLIWDRLPIALACAGLLAAVRAETVPGSDIKLDTALLALFAVGSVGWWRITDLYGAGDLRPYLFLQGIPLILIPMWQTIYRMPAADRLFFGAALLLYVLAKVAEINDHALHAATGIISGHTLKHLLATAAAAVLVMRLVQRSRKPITSTRCLHRNSPASR
jgi:hypothetical protein